MSIVFSDDFESGDFSAWDTVPAGGTRNSVTASAGMDGTTYGDEITPTDAGSAASQSLTVFTIVGNTLRLGFYLNKNDITALVPGPFAQATVIQVSTFSFPIAIRIYLKDTGSGIFIEYLTHEDDGTDHSSSTGLLASGEVVIEVKIARASTSGSADGEVELFINGSSVDSITGLDNYDLFADIPNGTLATGADNFTGDSTGSFYLDQIVLRDDDTPIYPPVSPSSGFRAMGMDADSGVVYVTGLRDGATLELYLYDRETLAEDPAVDTFGTITDADVDALTGGVYPAIKPGMENVVWLYGLDGNGVQTQMNDLNGVAGWVDLSDGGWSAMVVALLIDPLKPSDLLALLADDDIYRSQDEGQLWEKVEDRPFNLRTGQHRPVNGREVVMAGQGDNEIEYSHNYGETSVDIAIVVTSDVQNLEIQVAVANDDGQADIAGSTISFSFTSLGDSGAIESSRWARFDNVGIPQGATIVSAVLEVFSIVGRSGSLNVNLAVEDADDPAAPTTFADFAGRSRSSPAAAWAVPNMATGQWYTSADFSTSLQGVVNRPGFDEASAIQVFLDYQSGGNWRSVGDYNSKPAQAMKLVVEYTYALQPGTIRKIEVAQV